MNRKKLSKMRMKGGWIPSFVLVIIGFIHMKMNLVENVGVEYYMTKSPYLMKIKHYYLEYTKRMHMKANELIYPVQKRLLDAEAKKDVLVNIKKELEIKSATLPDCPKSGNEIRAYITLGKAKDKNIQEIAQIDAEIAELTKEIECLSEHETYSSERMLETAISKAYSYIEGCQKAAKAKSYYVRSEDHDNQLFEFISGGTATV